MRSSFPHRAARTAALAVLATAAAAAPAHATFPGHNGRIAYTDFYFPEGTAAVSKEIFTITQFGTDLSALPTPGWALHPRWSADGSRLAYTGAQPSVGNESDDNIAVADADGSHRRL